MSGMRVNETKTAYGVDTLADLRALVEALSDWPAESGVTLKGRESHSPIETDPAAITVVRGAK